MGGIGPAAYQSFLVGDTCVCVLCMELDLFSLECNEVSNSEFWGIYGFGLALGCPSFKVQVYVSVLLDN